MSDAVWDEAVNFMIRSIGLDKYLLEDPCSTEEYSERNITNGWVSGNIPINLFFFQKSD